MLRRLSIAATLLASLTSVSAFAAGNAAAGLQDLSKYNLIVLGDWTTGHDVEGTTLVGGNMSGNSGSLGIGAAANPGQTSVSSAPVLTVGGNNNSSNMNINNNGVSSAPGVAIYGNSNDFSSNITSSDTVLIGGNFYGTAKLPGGQNDVWQVGGNITNGANVDAGSLSVGGSITGSVNHNGGTVATGVSGLQSSIQSGISTTVSTVTADVKALSTMLANLTVLSPSSFSSSGLPGNLTLTLNAVDGGSGFALATLDLGTTHLSDFANISYNFASSTLPVFVNVINASGTVDFHLNAGTGFDDSANQQVIWNFVDATAINTTTEFHGSILAPYAALHNTTPIEGSVVAASFDQGGEVHLGTYNLGLPTPSVPEPASWAMMIGGLGLVGASMRRRAARVAYTV